MVSLFAELGADVSALMATPLAEIVRLAVAFRLQPVTPETTFEFENALGEGLREVGRRVLEGVFNQIEPAAAEMPKQIESEKYAYSRKNEKTPNRNGIGTTFGKIELSRCSYEPLREGREDQLKSISPLELSLGIVAHNATPALAERVGRAASDQTQNELLDMLPIRGQTKYKEAAVATVAVYDRRGKRLGTVYAGQMPQAHQTALSDDLTRLLTSVLQAWEGPMPRLAYVTDAGHHPTEYFDTVLAQMKDPRHPGQTLEWIRIVDFYHASEYIAKLSHALFPDDDPAAHAWPIIS